MARNCTATKVVNKVIGFALLALSAYVFCWLGGELAYAARIQQVYRSDEVIKLMAINTVAWSLGIIGIFFL